MSEIDYKKAAFDIGSFHRQQILTQCDLRQEIMKARANHEAVEQIDKIKETIRKNLAQMIDNTGRLVDIVVSGGEIEAGDR